MRLCGEVEGARERMRDGSLTLNSAALLQNAFYRQKRKQAGGGQTGVQAAVTPSESAPDGGALPGAASAPAQTGERVEEPQLVGRAVREAVERHDPGPARRAAGAPAAGAGLRATRERRGSRRTFASEGVGGLPPTRGDGGCATVR